MSANWLYGLHHHTDEPDQPQAMPVFDGQKLVVVGGSSTLGGLDIQYPRPAAS